MTLVVALSAAVGALVLMVVALVRALRTAQRAIDELENRVRDERRETLALVSRRYLPRGRSQ